MSLVSFSHTAGRSLVATLSRDEQKAMGQFMTPPEIAKFMAKRLVASLANTYVRLLEPAAGAGILAAAVVEELLSKELPPDTIDVLLCELDERFAPLLTELCNMMSEECKARGVTFRYRIHIEDFLTSEIAQSGTPIDGLVVISNPPYFKLTKSDPRSLAHSYAVYGQPNVYGLFMAACARLSDAGAKWCFITPRSWMTGAYFSAVRKIIFRCLQLDSFHAFESRKAHFSEDEILQEAVITWATGRSVQESSVPVLLTTSFGVRDLEDSKVQAMPVSSLIGCSLEHTITFPSGRYKGNEWNASLATFGLKVSTGPVVAFRARDFIVEHATPTTVPLLWMQHVRAGVVNWPVLKKREHIIANGDSAWMLRPNTPMVLLRRFSPKEDDRRVVAAAYLGDLPCEFIGLENHLNYIFRPGGVMTQEEAKGLAAYLNSHLADAFFRAHSGSTQVNAGELRRLPLPPLETLVLLGKMLPPGASLATNDELVEQILAEAAATELQHA